VRLEQAKVGDAVLVPQQAVTRSAQGDTVMVVDKAGVVSPRTVKIGNQQGSNWVVLGGLQAGEQVVVEGFQKMRPGAPVKAVAWNPGGASTGSPRTEAASAPASAPASAAKK
jgi:membrane fusion protein, multidrug efflux system